MLFHGNSIQISVKSYFFSKWTLYLSPLNDSIWLFHSSGVEVAVAFSKVSQLFRPAMFLIKLSTEVGVNGHPIPSVPVRVSV